MITRTLLMFLMIPTLTFAHHGVASLGVAGLEGPGAPVESSSSATLPDGAWLGTLKLDYAVFDTHTPARDDEGDRNAFWIYGIGYGVTPGLSLYAFVPYSVKKLEDNSIISAGFTDISLMGVYGFKWDEGLRRIPSSESLDDLQDWHFTLYGGLTLPTGDADFRDGAGNIDPGLSLGFGTTSQLAGTTATKAFDNGLTMVLDGSWIGFRENTYADDTTMLFGTEWRLNTALTQRLLIDADSKLRLDANLEANFLALGRDRADDVDEAGTGGRVLYLLPGLRLYKGSTSLGLGWKMPVWTDLNEDDMQQGAEGGETGRFILSWSTLF
jgi:Putative MetA-pathway of phenol degradation